MTVREVLLEATHRLELQRIPHPRLCAEVLLCHVLEVERSFLYSHDDNPVPEAQYAELENAIYERISGVPVQYIVGRQEFFGREFIVNTSVLIPRPETEHIVEAVLANPPPNGSRLIDIGTGSGCIAITLALELPQCLVFAADISEAAVHVARRNAQRLDAAVAFACADLFEGIAGKFDIVVSNPPYVPQGDLHRLQREVREHEPHVALFSPQDELAVYRRLIGGSFDRLKPGGLFLCEIGFDMEEKVLSLFDEGWDRLPTIPDLQGIPRTVMARKKS